MTSLIASLIAKKYAKALMELKKYEALIAPIADKLDKKIVALLELMSQKGRLNLIPELTQLLSKEIMAKENKFTGVVESNEKIDKSLLKKLEKKLSKCTFRAHSKSTIS